MKTTSNASSVGALINTKRRAAGLTQFDLAEQLRVSDQAVSKWERNLSRPNVHTSKRLAELLSITDAEIANAQKATPSRYKIVQAFEAYTTFGFVVTAIVLAVVATTLLILDQIDLRNAVILLGIAIFAIAIILLDIVDDKHSF
jgi:transcriptional regulator with XRE-family HTH domain